MPPNKPRDWFSIEHRFTVTSTEELFQYIDAVSYTLLDEADVAYQRSLTEQPFLAKNMLAMIGVNCDSNN